MTAEPAEPHLILLVQASERLVRGQLARLDFLIANGARSPLTDLEVEAEGREFDRVASFDVPFVPPAGDAPRPRPVQESVQLKLVEHGEGLIRLRARYLLDGEGWVATGQIARTTVLSEVEAADLPTVISAGRARPLDGVIQIEGGAEDIARRGPVFDVALTLDPRGTEAFRRELADRAAAERNHALALEWLERPYRSGVPQRLEFVLTKTTGAALRTIGLEVQSSAFEHQPAEERFAEMVEGQHALEPMVEVKFRAFEGAARAEPVARVRLLYHDANLNPNCLIGRLPLSVVAAGAGEPGEGVWRRVPLTYAAEWNQQIGLPEPPRATPGEPQRASYALCYEAAGESRRVHVHLGPRVLVGRRHGDNDIVPRYLPRSEENDHVSRKVSGRHADLHLHREGVRIEDAGSRNGTFVGSMKIPASQGVRLEDGAVVHLGGEIGYRLEEFRDFHGLDPETLTGQRVGDPLSLAYGRLLEETVRTRRDDAPLMAARLRRCDGGTDDIDHVLVLRSAIVGSEAGAAIVIQGQGLSERHARLHATPTGLEIEDLNSVGGTWVDGRRLDPRRTTPLTARSELRLGQLAVRIEVVERGEPVTATISDTRTVDADPRIRHGG